LPGRRYWLAGIIIAGLVSGTGVYSLSTAWASATNAGLIAATLVGIVWYSWETSKLVEAQRRSIEIDKHPWLTATNLAPQDIPGGADPGLFGGFRLFLPIRNVGETPAYNVSVQASHTTRVRATPDREGQSEFRNQVIVPGDTLTVLLGEVFFNLPPSYTRIVDVLVSIRYEVFDRGRGEIQLNFQYMTAAGWGNGDTRYTIWLADGRRWPEAAT
jgi:hypothetical protein